jgi:GNAT superfamily N-acetyltransferase
MTGFFAINFLGRAHPELAALFIDPDFIGQGWGRYLLGEAIAVANTYNVKTI